MFEPTKAQRKLLQYYLTYHQTAPTLGRMIQFNLKRWLLLLGFVVVTFLLNTALGIAKEIILWLGGMVLGVLLRDITSFRHFTRSWPVMDAMIDWPRLEKLLQEER